MPLYPLFSFAPPPCIDQVFAFDAVSYFLQAFAGEVLLVFPIVYGFTNSAPFNTWNIEFALYFFPFIITGVLPTVAALGWQKTPSARVSEALAGGYVPCSVTFFPRDKNNVHYPQMMVDFVLPVQSGLTMVPTVSLRPPKSAHSPAREEVDFL